MDGQIHSHRWVPAPLFLDFTHMETNCEYKMKICFSPSLTGCFWSLSLKERSILLLQRTWYWYNTPKQVRNGFVFAPSCLFVCCFFVAFHWWTNGDAWYVQIARIQIDDNELHQKKKTNRNLLLMDFPVVICVVILYFGSRVVFD